MPVPGTKLIEIAFLRHELNFIIQQFSMAGVSIGPRAPSYKSIPGAGILDWALVHKIKLADFRLHAPNNITQRSIGRAKAKNTSFYSFQCYVLCKWMLGKKCDNTFDIGSPLVSDYFHNVLLCQSWQILICQLKT